MKKNLSDIIDDMKNLVENDQDIGDYAKVFLKDFIDDLVAIALRNTRRQKEGWA